MTKPHPVPPADSPPMRDLGAEMEDALALLKQLASERFYGSVTLKFEGGRVVLLKKEQTLKPTDLSGQPRSRNAEKED